MSGYTPGPWSVGRKGTVVALVPIDEGPTGSEDTDFYGGYLICESVTKANARLISAAPEMLEALEELVRAGDRKTVEWDKARAAVKKARGEQ